MLKSLFYSFIILLYFFQGERQEPIIMGAFTHPFEMQDIYIYSSPQLDSAFGTMSSGEEGGWRVTLIDSYQHFFKGVMTEGPNSEDTIWLNSKDVGIVVQNYDSIPIKVFGNRRNTSVRDTIWWSLTARVTDFDRNQACITFFEGENEVTGWVSRDYLCDNPMTTCN